MSDLSNYFLGYGKVPIQNLQVRHIFETSLFDETELGEMRKKKLYL